MSFLDEVRFAAVVVVVVGVVCDRSPAHYSTHMRTQVGVGPAPPPEAKKQKALNDYEVRWTA
jgi:hypothetical protein